MPQDSAAANNAGDSAAFVGCLAHQAVVPDENHDHKGTVAIKAWFGNVSRKYQTILKPTKVATRGSKTVLTMLGSGDFPGSPLLFHNHLTVAGGKSTALSIKA